MDIFQLLLLFVGGILGGLYASSVGGGGLVSLPLLLLIGLPVHIALGTQRLAAMILETASAVKFYKERKIDFKVALPLAAISASGTLIGVNILIAINEQYLNFIVGALLIIIFLIIRNKEKLGVKEHRLNHKHYLLLGFFTFLLSIWGGFFGPGFGVFISMLFVFFGYTFIESAAISRVIGVSMSGVAMIVFAQHGYINYKYGLTLGLGFAIGSWIGISIALKKGNHYVKNLFIVIIFLTSLKLILDFFLG